MAPSPNTLAKQESKGGFNTAMLQKAQQMVSVKIFISLWRRSKSYLFSFQNDKPPPSKRASHSIDSDDEAGWSDEEAVLPPPVIAVPALRHGSSATIKHVVRSDYHFSNSLLFMFTTSTQVVKPPEVSKKPPTRPGAALAPPAVAAAPALTPPAAPPVEPSSPVVSESKHSSAPSVEFKSSEPVVS